MKQTKTNKNDICYHPRCINGGKAADFTNPRCWFEPNNNKKVFCTPECGADYLENMDELEKENRFYSKLKVRQYRKTEELAEAIYICSGKTFDLKTIKKVIKKLNLSSPWI
jgi:hypothetical protein